MDNNVIFNEADIGCHLDNHRGHYIQRDVIELAVGYGYIIGGFDQFVINLYESHSHYEDYPHEELTELCDAAIEWLNSGQHECPNCNEGIDPRDGDYWTHKDDAEGIKRCKRCTGTGRGPRIPHQNFPPLIPHETQWSFNDGDFGLYRDEDEELMPA